MYKLWACIIKDIKLITRDWVGLSLMFIMPILLVIVITALQAGTFELVNENKVPLLIQNNDNDLISLELENTLEKIGIFRIIELDKKTSKETIAEKMKETEALVAILIPENFSTQVQHKVADFTKNTLQEFGLELEKPNQNNDLLVNELTLYYHPVLQESYRKNLLNAIRSAVQVVESKQIISTIYSSINETAMPDSILNNFETQQVHINEIPVSRDGSEVIPNAAQHNVPAWTIFAMFFIITSLGSSVVKEKNSGSSLRLKTLPTNFLITIFSKQITYLLVAMSQVFVIFSTGVFLFPFLGLPALNIPTDIVGLILVSLISGWCAVSYAIAVGVFSETQEQANGFGAISVVILAAFGGILVPKFAMPESFAFFLKISPMHWSLESYYGLFLEGGKFSDIINNVIPLLLIIILFQLIAYIGLKKNNLI
ncbi:MAG: ABC transporter permease [Flavobacteriales bacterium CG18_big_fil_WC_8_21_14_2_50_32_9]|nr:MAG: ABC transporter permease [Flavobacteriales bacterium CG18_big_fil_WC_8_21_14_2_50_32_9]